jgi:hypothetical protein
LLGQGNYDLYQSTTNVIMALNDAPRRRYREIAAVLRAAKKPLAEADGGKATPNRVS